jgi:hypothetical protein
LFQFRLKDKRAMTERRLNWLLELGFPLRSRNRACRHLAHPETALVDPAEATAIIRGFMGATVGNNFGDGTSGPISPS